LLVLVAIDRRVNGADRPAANRCGLRYPSDLTDAEWALVEPAVAQNRKLLLPHQGLAAYRHALR
jgi:hypothetical protein